MVERGVFIMKILKNLFGFLMAIIFSFTSINFVFAASTVISTDNLTADAGKTVSVPIKISGNITGVSTFGMKINYDSSVMTPKSSVTKGVYTSDIIFNPTYKNTPGVAFATGAATDNKTGDGSLFSIDFDINANAVKGKNYPISIEVLELKYISNAKTMDVEHTITNGGITINGSSGGSSGEGTSSGDFNFKYDVDGDHKLTANDLAILLQKVLNPDFKLPNE